MKNTKNLDDYYNYVAYAMSKGLIDIDQVLADVNSAKRDEVINRHKYAIWQGKNGRWFTYLPDPNRNVKGKLVKRCSREKLEEALVRYYMQGDSSSSFGDCFRMQQTYCLEHGKISKNTYDRKYNYYDKYIKGTSFEEKRIEEITEGFIITFFDGILSDNRGEITRKGFENLKSLVAQVFIYARIIKGYKCILIREVLESIVPNPKLLKKQSDKEQVFDEEEVSLLINTILGKYRNSIRHIALLFILFTGLRLGELLVLKIDDVSKNYKIRVRRQLSREKDDNGKTHQYIKEYAKTEASEAEIIMSDDAIDVFEYMVRLKADYGDASEWLVSENGHYLSHGKMDKCLRKLCAELGIPVRSCHKLRKTNCSLMLDAGISEKVVQEQLRHTDIRTTQKHYHFCIKTEQAKRDEINRVRLLKDGI